MARDIERTVQQSLLDRLTDDAPGFGDRELTWGESVRALKQAVRRDLEWLLNTRRTPQPVPAACTEVRRSLYRYGLPDYTARSRDERENAVALAREVEEAIALFEPRLAGARVSLAETQGDDGGRRLHFVIEALLRLDPTPERVVFDTVLDVAKNEFAVAAPGAGMG
jgi:type VI secretion system protein ImpF